MQRRIYCIHHDGIIVKLNIFVSAMEPKRCVFVWTLFLLPFTEGRGECLKEVILSVGIDLGTTTTQLILSRITLENTTGSFSNPQIKIVSKEIIYKSKIYFTPLLSFGEIDFVSLKEIILKEYEKAQIDKKSIDTGAVIITGETSGKENSKEVLRALSEFAGDFVVAEAGPDLESILAGFGSGIAEISKNTASKIINFDVGGGTTNAALFNSGDTEDAFALDIGGRLIKFGTENEITYISAKIERLIEKFNLNLNIGSKPELSELKKLTDILAGVLLKIAKNESLESQEEMLFIGHKTRELKANSFSFSGGVSEFVYSDKPVSNLQETAEFGDIGPLLGYSIREVFNGSNLKIEEPQEKIRATVIGAGSHSITISGSTIAFDEEILPIKNIPIIKLSEDESGIIKDNITNKLKMYKNTNIALAFKGPKSPSYAEIKSIAFKITEAIKCMEVPVIVIAENDFAKALGQTINNILGNAKRLICIDGIRVEKGDYVDIGKPVAGVIPVVIKTLIFNK